MGFFGEHQFVVGEFDRIQIQCPHVAFHRTGGGVGFVVEGEGGFLGGFVFKQAGAGGELDAADFGDAARLSGHGTGDVRVCRHQSAVFGFLRGQYYQPCGGFVENVEAACAPDGSVRTGGNADDVVGLEELGDVGGNRLHGFSGAGCCAVVNNSLHYNELPQPVQTRIRYSGRLK